MSSSSSSIAQSFYSYINSFATVSYPTRSTQGHGIFAPIVPVNLLHVDTQKAVPVTGGLLVDTGAEDTVINERYAKLIGIDDLKKGVQYNIGGAGGGVGGTFYQHRIPLRIANLKPVVVHVLFGPQIDEDQVLGRGTLREYIIALTLQTIKVSEYQQAATQAAYAQALNASMLLNSRSNVQGNYRNRI